MKKFNQITLVFTLLVTVLCSQFAWSTQQASANSDDILDISAEAAILLDAETGKILYEKNADKVLGVASMSKMMTEYIVLEAINEGKIKWDQNVQINEYVHNLSKAPGLSNVGLTQGESYTVKELYQAMAIFSGNAATVALAELVSGSEKNFVKLMNEKAAELGMKDYTFVNASGLNNSNLLGVIPAGSETDENVMSARDTAILAYRLITDFPEVLETSSKPTLKFRDGEEYPNFNWMLPGLIFEYKGVDGLKTGSTDFAGYCFTATAERDGQRYISVVMKSSTKNERFTDTQKILNYAFSNFSSEELLKKNYAPKKYGELAINKGKEKTVALETSEALDLVVKKGTEDSYKPVVVINEDLLNKDGKLEAPIKKGDVIGYVTVESSEDPFGYLTNDGEKAASVDLVAAETVEKANWFVLSMRAIGGFFGDVWDTVSSTVKGWF
ncbi:D-alanyl-D-alanine carboxypeptidase [Bacillus sp. AGMB 02131]|uniref:serine-type D-Ala-D-Ala carboxypeptidase n=1 Tax=Peribacillus faecalis TaxID=2772559 RepID=A0A927HE12_9BACI|nr:serine hydrolase [Peribacillus faecalis]MBD3110033.1 D-alanyl-D-alanine carboxypeptidase [Peribacillus faecalis]